MNADANLPTPEPRRLRDGCIACNSSKTLCDCIIWFEGRRCCDLCEHLKL